MLTEDLRLDTGLLDTFLPLVKANYLDFIDRFEADPVEALQPVCAPFTEAEDYSWRIHVDEQMVNDTGQWNSWRSTAVRQNCAERRSARRRPILESCCSTVPCQGCGSCLGLKPHQRGTGPGGGTFVQAMRQTGQWTQEDEAGYHLYRQETDPEKRTFRAWYLIANPRGLPKEFVQKELEFRWKLFPEKKEESK